MGANVRKDEYILSKEFAAPIDLVFDAWTKPEHLTRWLKPPGWTCEYAEADIRPGGRSLHCMKSPEGWEMWELKRYEKVERPSLITCIHSLTNEQGEIVGNPRQPDWPKELMTIISFESTANGTTVTFKWSPHNASEAEIQCFNESVQANAGAGWNMAFANLEDYLSKVV